jgi:LPXTG-motif cell wall-anchored protein
VKHRRRRHRRHHAAEANPTSNTTRWLVIGGLTAAAGLGLYFYMKKTAANPALPPKP